MSDNVYGQEPVITVDTPETIVDSNGENIVEVAGAKKKVDDDTDWMYKLGPITPSEANVEGFNNFSRVFATMGFLPNEEQQSKLEPILTKLYALGFTNRCKDTGFTEEFYTWTAGRYKRNEFYITYKKKGITFTPIITEVARLAIEIILDARITRFPKTDLERFAASKDIVKQMAGLNTHIALGVNLESPLSFLILNTPNGEEPGDRMIDFDTIGFNSDILYLASKYNIPTFNISKEGSFERLEEFIKTFE